MQYCKDLVSVSIVTLNQPDSLEECIQSLSIQTYPHLEIIIVNNAQEEILDNFKVGFPPVKVINNRDNFFYAQAQNLGIKASTGEFVLCLNDDVILDINFIEKILRGFGKDRRIGMVSGKVLSFYDRKMIDSTGLFLGKSRKPVDRGYKRKDSDQFNKEGYIFGVPGAVGMYKREMLENISMNGDYFDSEYGIFYEDLDLCWRAHNRGWKAYYQPEAVAYHKRGKTVKNNQPALKFLKKYELAWLQKDLQLMLLTNRYRTIMRNDRWMPFLRDLLFIINYEIKAWNYLLLVRPALIYALLRDLSWLKDAFGKRRSYGRSFKRKPPH